LPDHAGKVHGRWLLVKFVQEIGKWIFRNTILSYQNGRDALTDYVFGVQVLEYASVSVAVHVGKPGRKSQSMFVDHLIAGLRPQVLTHIGNVVIVNTDIAMESFFATAVVDR
jgi:hypothetical protein